MWLSSLEPEQRKALLGLAHNVVVSDGLLDPNEEGMLDEFKRATVILGVIGIARTGIEAVEAIRERLTAALDHIDADRLIAAPDCGLIMLDRETTAAKLKNLVAAARTVQI